MENSEGGYLFGEFCDKHGYPKTYEELKEKMKTDDSEILDEEWDRIGQHFERSLRYV
jgi:hypothetical protein